MNNYNIFASYLGSQGIFAENTEGYLMLVFKQEKTCSGLFKKWFYLWILYQVRENWTKFLFLQNFKGPLFHCLFYDAKI